MLSYCASHGALGPTRSKFDLKAVDLMGDQANAYDPIIRRDEDAPWEFRYGFETGARRSCLPPDKEDVESWWDPLYLAVEGWTEKEPFVLRPEDGEERGFGPGQRPPYMLRGKEL